MRLFRYILFSCILGWSLGLAMASTRNDYKDSKPQDILDSIVKYEDSEIIDTKLDTVTKDLWWFSGNPELKIVNTLDEVRTKISPYLQRVAYLWLAGAVTLIIYNWLLLVMSPLTPDQAAKVKTRMLYITLGAILITWFYFVLKILLAVYYDIFVS